jgi:hypothetical protein
MKITEELQKLIDQKNWDSISEYQKLSEKFIEKFSEKVNWVSISTTQMLSEKFIEKHSDTVVWNFISKYQKLSQKFIEKFSDKVYWGYISRYQKLSEKFIEKHSDMVDWYCISKYQKLSEKFRKKHNIKISENNWLYASDEKKLKSLKKLPYEIVDGNIIAYKGVRFDGYSNYNFQYHYEVGKTYTSHCDCNLKNENSFGLSAWTLEKAKGYCNQKILKVSIPISKLGAVVHEGDKLRAFEMTVLEEVS